MQRWWDTRMMRNGAPGRTDEKDSQHPWPDDENGEATDGNLLGLRALPSPQAPKAGRWLGLFIFVLLSLTMAATVIVVSAARDKKASLLEAEEKRLQESVVGRVNILRTWLEGRHAASRRLTDSQVFRLFVADLALQDRRSPLPRSLQDQRPYFRQLMADFARQNDLARATILSADGATLLSSPGPVLPVADIMSAVEDADTGWTMRLSAIRHVDDRSGPLVVDAVIPFPEIQAENENHRKPAAVLVLTLPIEGILNDILAGKAFDPAQERIMLLQQRGESTETFSHDGNGIVLGTSPLPDDVRAGMATAFGRRHASGEVYSLGAPVEGVSWTVYQALDARTALAPVHDFVQVAAVLSALTVIALAAVFSAVWWRQGRNHQRQMADVFKANAHRIEQQRQFLQAVTRSIGDWLSVSAPDGKLIYVNPAFEVAAGRTAASVMGESWHELVRTVPADDQRDVDLAGLIDADEIDVVEVGTSRYHISPTVSDLKAEDGSVRGTVRVVRDHSERVADRRRRLQAMAQTVDAFVHAIELRDPFLLGHTERVRRHAIAIGTKLGLAHDELAGLALAASLSQIGKIFIPDDILAKPERHSAEEGDIMRGHILHAVDILGKIDFDLPIVDIIAQMHERLDGTGYPHGLRGDRIGLGGRILGVADVFCARTAPRSYRDRMSAGKTLFHLANNQRRYDLRVVAALADIVGHGLNLGDPDTVEQGFIDAAVWREKHRSLDRAMEPA